MKKNKSLEKMLAVAGLIAGSAAVITAGAIALSYVASEVHYANMNRKIRFANVIIHTPAKGDIPDKYWKCEHGMDAQLRHEYLKRLAQIPYNLRKEPNYVGANDSTAPFTPPSTIRTGIPLYLPDVDGDGHVGCTQHQQDTIQT